MDDLLIMEEGSVGYRQRVVLAGLNLRIARGSFTAILGGNGAGKTTLLKTVAGILPLVAGRLVYPPQAGHAPLPGYVPQREALDPLFLLSAFEVALMGVCGRVTPALFIGRAEREWVRHCLAQTGASDFSRRRFSELSGGQKQRVLIARALAVRPDMLLLDEPTAGLDVASGQAIMELLQQIHREQQLTILLVTHELLAVRELVQDVIWLRDGQALHGPASALLTREKVSEVFKLDLF